MSDDLNELERQLEQATARSAPSGEPLDAESASLREAWLAFGHLLAAAQPATDEERVASGEVAGGGWRVASGENADPSHPLTPSPPHPVIRPPRRLKWLVLTAVGLAATLLAAVTIAWMMRGDGTQGAGSGGRVVRDEGRGIRGEGGESPLVPHPSSLVPADLAWDDTLDKQIVLAGEAVLSVQEDWSVLADAANSVRYGIRQMEKDVQGSPL